MSALAEEIHWAGPSVLLSPTSAARYLPHLPHLPPYLPPPPPPRTCPRIHPFIADMIRIIPPSLPPPPHTHMPPHSPVHCRHD